MVSEEPAHTEPVRVTVTLEVQADITDAAALRDAATTAITNDEQLPDNERAEATAAVAADVTEAVTWLLDPLTLVDDLPGVEPVGAIYSTAPGGDQQEQAPDYAALFPLDGQPDDTWYLTPRTAAVLHHTLELLADDAYDDADEYGDDPADTHATVLGRLPQLSWSQDLQWRRQFARAFDDLAADIADGHWPLPRCTAEELALHLALADAPDVLEISEVIDPLVEVLPEHPDDFDWEMCDEALLQDHDVQMLYDPAHDGIEDPDGDTNRELGAGDLRPHTWFRPFLNAEPRDLHRGFRR